MRLKKPWMRLRSYVGEQAYRQLYARVAEARDAGRFSDGHYDIIREFSCCLGGVLKEAPYKKLFDAAQRTIQEKFRLKSANEQRGNIAAKRGGIQNHSGGLIFVDFYLADSGIFIEARSEAFAPYDWQGAQKDNVTEILLALMSLPREPAQPCPFNIKTLDDRIREVLTC